VIARLVGVAIDARAARSRDPREAAEAARWIAGNLLAIRGLRLGVDGAPPPCPRVLALAARDLTGVLAAIAAVPALVDAATLPRRWRLALRALGVPVVDRPVPLVLAGGASVVVSAPASAPCALRAVGDATGYHVHVAPAERMLVA